MSVGHIPNQQVTGSRAHRLSGKLSVHGQLSPVEGPQDGQRRVALEDVTGKGDVVTRVQRLFSSVNGKLWWNCNWISKIKLVNQTVPSDTNSHCLLAVIAKINIFPYGCGGEDIENLIKERIVSELRRSRIG